MIKHHKWRDARRRIRRHTAAGFKLTVVPNRLHGLPLMHHVCFIPLKGNLWLYAFFTLAPSREDLVDLPSWAE
ncbi:MAG TPA: hypothetical protein PKI05_02425 [Thermogutta sp.]|nr:hypothetical protein [Thermogutta sp.]